MDHQGQAAWKQRDEAVHGFLLVIAAPVWLQRVAYCAWLGKLDCVVLDLPLQALPLRP